MKKIILGFLGLFISFVVVSQSKFYILTEDRKECFINVNTGNVFDCSQTIKTPGVFIMDDNYSDILGKEVFVHMVPGITSIYDALSVEVESGVLIIENTSDTGNKYVHFFDFNNNYISILFMNPNELRNGTNRRIVTFKIAEIHTFN